MKKIKSPKTEKRLPLNPEIEKVFREFLQYCNDEGIDNILFTRFPHILTNKLQKRRAKMTNAAEDIIKEYGYDFINLEKNFEFADIDYKKDFSSKDHLNMYGQKKVTEYLGKVLTEKYGVTKTSLTDEQKAQWDECVKYNNMLYRACDDRLKKGKKAVLNEVNKKFKIIKEYE